jgi:hypothetical protein
VLPVPAPSVFELPEGLRRAMQSAARRPHQAEQTLAAEPAKDGAKPLPDAASGRATAGKSHIGRLRRADAVHGAGRAGRHAGQPARRALKRLVQAKKRSV